LDVVAGRCAESTAQPECGFGPDFRRLTFFSAKRLAGFRYLDLFPLPAVLHLSEKPIHTVSEFSNP
jgi:hypothetical protein